MIRSILAVGHDASRTGAPSTLASLLGWASDAWGSTITTVLLRGGPLAVDLARLGPVRVPPPALTAATRLAAASAGAGITTRVEAAWLRRALRPAAGGLFSRFRRFSTRIHFDCL